MFKGATSFQPNDREFQVKVVSLFSGSTEEITRFCLDRDSFVSWKGLVYIKATMAISGLRCRQKAQQRMRFRVPLCVKSQSQFQRYGMVSIWVYVACVCYCNSLECTHHAPLGT